MSRWALLEHQHEALIENIEFLAENGNSVEQICTRLGLTKMNYEQIMRRKSG